MMGVRFPKVGLAVAFGKEDLAILYQVASLPAACQFPFLSFFRNQADALLMTEPALVMHARIFIEVLLNAAMQQPDDDPAEDEIRPKHFDEVGHL